VSLRHPSGQSFLSLDPFGVWGTPGLSLQGHACVKNLPRVGGEVCAKFSGDWSGGSGVKRGHRYKQSLLYIEIMYMVNQGYFFLTRGPLLIFFEIQC